MLNKQKIKRTIGLSVQIAKAEFKLKNEGTWLGVFWYLLAPILTFAFMLGIFKDRLGNDIPNYPLYLFLGIIIFNYFRKIADSSVAIVKEKPSFVKSLNFPRESLVISIAFKTLFAHLFEILILLGFCLFFGIPIFTMAYYPLVLIFLTFFSIGVGLILASVGAYFYDMHQIWGFGVNIIWFITPIFYAIEGQKRLLALNMLNPMYFFITFARDLIIYVKMPEYHVIVGTISYSILFLSIGFLIFNKAEKRFAEVV